MNLEAAGSSGVLLSHMRKVISVGVHIMFVDPQKNFNRDQLTFSSNRGKTSRQFID